MAKVKVRLFGVLRVDTHLAEEELEIEKVKDIFPSLNHKVDEIYEANLRDNPGLERPDAIEYKHIVLFINGERCKSKSQKLNDGDELWVLSPASGG